MELPGQDTPVNKKTRGKGGWAAGAGLLVLLGKFKPILLLLLKLGKPIGTMLLSVGAYALLFPWTFALGFVLLLCVHELGHVWAARRRGLPVSSPMFIPFFGAFITMKQLPKDAETEAYIGIGGPLLGTAGAFVCYGIGAWSGAEIWYALAYSGFFLNLINLMPIHPLDGGRIVTAVSRWLWVVGAVAGPFIIWRLGSGLFFMIWLLSLWELYKKFVRNHEIGEKYVVTGEYRTPIDFSLPSWYWSGASHSRELPYTAYCRMDGVHVVEFWWEALSFKGELSLPQRCVIDRVRLTNVKERPDTGELSFAVRMEGRLFEPQHFDSQSYYQVPLKTRFRYGILYGGLVAVLVYMTWKIGAAGLLVPA